MQRQRQARDGRPQAAASRVKEGSDEEGFDEEVQTDILIASGRAEGHVTPVGGFRSSRRSWHDHCRCENTIALRNLGDERIHRLLFLGCRSRGRGVVIVAIGMIATHHTRGHVAERHELVNYAVEREHAATDEEHRSRQERHGHPSHPDGGDHSTFHPTRRAMHIQHQRFDPARCSLAHGTRAES